MKPFFEQLKTRLKSLSVIYLIPYVYSAHYKIWQVSNIGDNKIMGLLMRVPLAGRRTLKKERHLYCQKNKHLSIYFVIILLHVWVTLSVPYVFFFLCTHLSFSFCFSIICFNLIFGIFSITTHYKIIFLFVC